MSKSIGFEKLMAYFHLEGFENSSALIRMAKLFKISSHQLAQIIIAVLLGVLLLITRMYIDRIIIFLVGVLYPLYKCLNLIENMYSLKRNGGMWLSYWVCYGIYTTIQGIIQMMFKGLPFLYIMEAGFLIWLYHKKTRGADLANIYVFMPALRQGTFLVKQLKGKIINRPSAKKIE